MLGRRVDLVTQLADEPDAHHPAPAHRQRRPRAPRGTETPRWTGPSSVSWRQHIARPRTGQVHRGIGTRHIDHTHLQAPHRVQPRQLPIHVGRAGGRRREVEVLLGQPRHHAVVDDHSRLVHHHGISRHADLQIREASGIHPLQELRRIRSEQIHLAQRAHVDQTHAACAPRAPPRARIRAWLLPARSIVLGPQPVAGLHEHRAGRARDARAAACGASGGIHAPPDATSAPDGRTAARWWCRPSRSARRESCARMRTAFMLECLPWLGPMPTVV